MLEHPAEVWESRGRIGTAARIDHDGSGWLFEDANDIGAIDRLVVARLSRKGSIIGAEAPIHLVRLIAIVLCFDSKVCGGGWRMTAPMRAPITCCSLASLLTRFS